jgi:hypothetical protein
MIAGRESAVYDRLRSHAPREARNFQGPGFAISRLSKIGTRSALAQAERHGRGSAIRPCQLPNRIEPRRRHERCIDLSRPRTRGPCRLEANPLAWRAV